MSVCVNKLASALIKTTLVHDESLVQNVIIMIIIFGVSVLDYHFCLSVNKLSFVIFMLILLAYI